MGMEQQKVGEYRQMPLFAEEASQSRDPVGEAGTGPDRCEEREIAGSPRAAKASATFFTLIETAKANGLEPFDYLKTLFERLPLANSKEDF